MRGLRRDWLDALAQHTAGRVVPGAPATHDVTASDDHRFSRTTGLKLALAGAASLSLGLWNAAPARAQTREGCFTGCLTEHDKELKRRLQSCRDVFHPGMKKKWAQYSGFFPPISQIAIARAALTGFCYAKAAHDVAGDKDDCYENCETGCRSRRVQSASSFAVANAPTCEATPPHRAPKPEIPTPPNPENDVCAICMGQGNVCCPGGSIAAGGLCACAPPETPCEIYAGSCA